MGRNLLKGTLYGSRLAQIRAQVSGKAALAVRAGKKQVPFSGSQLFHWQEGNKTVCLPFVFQKYEEESNKVTGRKAVKKLLSTFHGQKPLLMCWVGPEEDPARVHLHTPARLPGLCLDALDSFYVAVCANLERYCHFLLFLCADAETKAQGDEVNFP